jgi:hypothetical protein
MKILRVCLLFAAFSLLITFCTARAEILMGWYTEVNNSEAWPGHAANGCNFFHLSGANWFRPAEVKAKLDIVQSLGGKASVDMKRTSGLPELDLSEYTNFINHVKTHPAVWGWYIADEPDLCPERRLSVETCRHRLAINPGWYRLTKSLDPARYAWLVLANKISPGWNDCADIIALDTYPVYYGYPGFEAKELRHQPDLMKSGLDWAEAYNKKPFIAVVQAFGGYGNWTVPNFPQMKYQVFSALVQGVKVILWFHDGWASDNLKRMAAQVQRIIKDISPQMDMGTKNDRTVTMNQNLVAQDRIIFRYGLVGEIGAILAVNVANRDSANGEMLSNVQFTLPVGVRPSQVEVLGENRTLPVNNGEFADNFNPFEVHIYRFTKTPRPASKK